MIPFSVKSESLVAADGILEIQSDVSNLLATIDASTKRTEISIGVPLAILYLMMVFIVFSIQMSRMRTNERAMQLASKLAETDAANKAKSEFLSLMSHELRTPLNAIIGFSQLIDQNEQDKAESENGTYARTIYDSGHHMLRQITSILDMTAIELGELEMELAPMHIEDAARQAISRVQDTFDQSLVTLTVHNSPALPRVMGDMGRLQQVFENLLSNAARFTPAGGEVDVVFATEPGGWICVGIKDTGVGMTREQIERVRLPFQQTWNGLSREADGAGLGLTIADKIIIQMGGELVIESLQEVGTKIVVRLPALDEEPSATRTRPELAIAE
jgi:signal transduction histidine kinase